MVYKTSPGSLYTHPGSHRTVELDMSTDRPIEDERKEHVENKKTANHRLENILFNLFCMGLGWLENEFNLLLAIFQPNRTVCKQVLFCAVLLWSTFTTCSCKQ